MTWSKRKAKKVEARERELADGIGDIGVMEVANDGGQTMKLQKLY